MMSTHIAGASVWEQEIYDHVSGHVATEGAILDEYQRLAEDPAGSPAFVSRGLILADERRHHQLFNDLAESIRQFASCASTTSRSRRCRVSRPTAADHGDHRAAARGRTC